MFDGRRHDLVNRQGIFVSQMTVLIIFRLPFLFQDLSPDFE
jgi:hypothetical protein